MNTDKNLEVRKMVDIEHIANAIGFTKSGIFNLMKAGKFPQGVKIGSARRWDLEEINQWLKNPELPESKEALS